MPRQTGAGLWLGVLTLIIQSVGSWLVERCPQAEAQEVKRFLYKVVDIQPDNAKSFNQGGRYAE